MDNLLMDVSDVFSVTQKTVVVVAVIILHTPVEKSAFKSSTFVRHANNQENLKQPISNYQIVNVPMILCDIHWKLLKTVIYN